MRKRMWNRVVAIVCVLAMLLSWSASAGTEAASAKPVEAIAEIFEKISELPKNIQSLLERFKEGEVIVPSDSPYELTIQRQDGSYTTEVYSVPVKYTDDEGQVQYIDTSMKKRSLWDILTFDHTYRNQDGYVALEYAWDIAKGIGVDDVFTMSVPERKEQEEAECTSTEDGAGKVVYPQAFGEHTYVEYINTYAGFKENIVLEQNIGQNTFDFVWESDTHIPVLIDDNKAIQIVSKTNPQQVDYTISPLYVYDSFDPTTSDDPYAHKHWTEDCRYDIIDQGDGVYTIRAIVSEEYLNHPETVYPVTIDPSVTAKNDGDSVEDGFVKEDGGKGYDYDYLQFGYLSGRIYSYVKYDYLPTIPAGAYFTDAKFKVTFRTGQNTPADMKGTVKSVQGNFDESALTWSNKPTPKTTQSSVLPKITDGYLDYYDFTVTSAVRDWYTLKNPNYGLMFTYQTETYNDYNSVVSSDGDAARAPKLTINYSVTTAQTSGITDDGYYYIRNRSTGQYLTLSDDSMSVELADYTGARNQLWQTQYDGNGAYFLVPRANTARCLRSGQDSDGGGVSAMAIPSATDSEEERNACLFRITFMGTGRYRFASKATSAFYAVTGGRYADDWVETYTYTGATDQQWYFEEYSLSLTAEKEWVVVNKVLRITPSTMALNLTWSTSDADVAFVFAGSSGGLVGAESPGTVTITATAENGVSASCTVYVYLSTTIYQSERLPGKDENEKTAADMITNDKSRQELYSMNPVLGDLGYTYDQGPASSSVLPPQGPSVLYDNMRRLSDYFCTSDSSMQEVVDDMINHFLNGSGSSYRNSVLTQKVVSHESTQRFINGTKNAFIEYLTIHKGDVDAVLSDEKFIERLISVGRPHYDTSEDMKNGLKIAINDTWGYKIYLKNYYFDGINYSGTIDYTIYDHFGLDDGDVTDESGWYLGYTNEFGSWYVLQHYEGCNNAYQPFVTYIETSITISGSIN